MMFTGENIMKEKVRQIISKESMLYIVIAVAMMTVFCSVYGVSVLNPAYVDWLLGGSDLTQHYLGWVAYRVGDWNFPIGMTDYLAYPNKTSIIFTDSIPCFAVLFKILSPFLPAKFQYFGLWGILCFVLQGVLSARIIRKFVDNKVYVLGASILFAFTPALLYRMYVHTALAGQWIILLALEPLFAYKSYLKNKRWKIYTLWMVIGALASSIHIYYILMCGIILLGYCFLDIISQKRIFKSVLLLVTYLLTSAGVVGILGGYASAGSIATGGGLGDYSMNLNAFINPMGYSYVLKSLNSLPGQYEGFAYLGLGDLLILIFSIIIFGGYNGVKKIFADHRNEFLAISAVFVTAIIVAVSPIITWNDRILFTLRIPAFVTKMWSIFRSSGRISWTALYIIVIGSCIVTYKILSKRTAVIALFFCLAFQVYDLRDILQSINTNFSEEVAYESILQDGEFWRFIGEEDIIKHIVFTDPMPEKAGYAFAEWALNYDKTLSFFPLAHRNIGMFAETVQDSLQELSETDLFIFTEANRLQCYKYGLHYYISDGYIIGYCDSLELPEYEVQSAFFSLTYQFSQNQYLDNGEDINGLRNIYSGGLSYGPYWNIPSGTYKIVIRGANLLNLLPEIYSGGGSTFYEFDILSQTEDSIEMIISIEQDANNLEIVIRNELDGTISLSEITLQPITQ